MDWSSIALKDIIEIRVDIEIFAFQFAVMDIEMPLMNGMDAAKHLRESGNVAPLIFITNMGQFAVHGYEVNALDFMVKPISYFSFSKKFQRAVKQVNTSRGNYVTLITKSGLTKISLDEINYVEVKGHRVIYHTANEEMEIRSTMKETEDSLKDKGFARCNNCWLVNLKNVYEVKKDDVRVGNEWLTISRTKKKEFMNALTVYLTGGNI